MVVKCTYISTLVIWVTEAEIKLVMPLFSNKVKEFFSINQMSGLADSWSYLKPYAF